MHFTWVTMYDWIGLVLMTVIIFACFNPIGCFTQGDFFHQQARNQLGYTILQILIAPFGSVRFRDFFFADCLTSMKTPLTDIGYIVIHFTVA